MALRDVSFNLYDAAARDLHVHAIPGKKIERNGENVQMCANHTETSTDKCFKRNIDAFNGCTGITLTTGYATELVKNLTNCVPLCFYGNKTEQIDLVPESRHYPEGEVAWNEFYRLNETVPFCANFSTACGVAIAGFNTSSCQSMISAQLDANIQTFNGNAAIHTAGALVVTVLATSFFA